MKKILLLVSIINCFVAILLADEISISETPQKVITDSFNTSEVVEIVQLASEKTKSDSSDVIQQLALESAQIDSLADFRIKAKQQLDEIASTTTIEAPLDFYYQEGFHIKTALGPNQDLVINGFSRVDTLRTTDLLLQSYLPFYQPQNNGEIIELDNRNYAMEIPLTISQLGLGGEEMNHGYFSFHKGKIFTLNNLNLETSYLGTTGNWYGVNEKMANFNLHLWYTPTFGSVHYYLTKLDQDISTERFHFDSDKTILSDKETSQAAVYKNKFIDFGFKQTESKLDSLETKYNQIFTSAHFQNESHQLALTFEQFFNDYDFYNLRWKQNSSLHNFRFINNGYLNENEDYQYSSLINYNWQQFALGAKLVQRDEDISQRNLLGQIAYDNNGIRLEIEAGEVHTQAVDWQLAQTNAELNIPIKNFVLHLRNKFQANLDAPETSPEYQSISTAALHFNLKYDNRIRIGVTNHYASDYIYKNYLVNADNWDFFLKLQITKYFEIYGNFVNIFNSSTMYNQTTILPESHFIYGFKWIFVN